MKYRRYGSPDEIELVECEEPTPKSDEVLIRVGASSVNPIDWKLASGKFKLVRPVCLPATPGFDVAGEIVKKGAEVEDLEVGERVFVRLATTFGGASAEAVCAKRSMVARAPKSMNDIEAAAVPLAGLTALQCLRDHGGLPMEGAEGKRVLVVGASGGVGHYAVQIARAAGAHAVGVCSGPNVALVEELGAHEVIDYRSTDDFGVDYDVILDGVGQRGYHGLKDALTEKGRYVSVNPSAKEIAWTVFTRATGSRRCNAMMLEPNGKDLAFLASLADAGKLKSVVEQVFPLEELAEAHRASMAGRTRGKIVIAVGTEVP